MFAAAISLVGLAATVYLVLREAKAICAQSGTVAKSALGWSVAFGLFQLFLTIWGAIGLVAQNEPLAFVMLALILVVDFVLYYPFFRAYDAQKCAEEAEISQEELAAKNAEKAAKLNDAFQGKAVPAARRRLCAAGHGGLVQPRLYLGLPPVHPARVGHHHRAHGRPVLPVPAPRRSSRGPGLCPLCPGHCRVLRHHV